MKAAWIPFLLAGIAAAADVDGYLVDKACSARVIKGGQKVAATHTKDCALMDGCLPGGFGVLTADGKYLLFDKAGNKKAEEALNKSAKTDNLKVRVTGKVVGDKITVGSVKLL